MIGAVDIGGTKTLVAAFTNDGKLVEQERFPTPQNYDQFLIDLQQTVSKLTTKDFERTGVAIPGQLDRKHGIAISCGNLPWAKVHIEADTEKIFNSPVRIENDAKAAGIAESKAIANKFNKVLYLAIGTGIGISYIVNGINDYNIHDLGGHVVMLEHKGKISSWESFASGRAILEKYGKKASEIKDKETWKAIAHNFTVGILDLLAITSADVIVIGGGIGVHFDRFGSLLTADLKKYETPLLPIPSIKQAKHAEEAVIYGCYELAKERSWTS